MFSPVSLKTTQMIKSGLKIYALTRHHCVCVFVCVCHSEMCSFRRPLSKLTQKQFIGTLAGIYMTDLTDSLNFWSETFRFMEEMAEMLNLLNDGNFFF